MGEKKSPSQLTINESSVFQADGGDDAARQPCIKGEENEKKKNRFSAGK